MEKEKKKTPENKVESNKTVVQKVKAVVQLTDGSSEVVFEGKRMTGNSLMTLDYTDNVKDACNKGVLNFKKFE